MRQDLWSSLYFIILSFTSYLSDPSIYTKPSAIVFLLVQSLTRSCRILLMVETIAVFFPHCKTPLLDLFTSSAAGIQPTNIRFGNKENKHSNKVCVCIYTLLSEKFKKGKLPYKSLPQWWLNLIILSVFANYLQMLQKLNNEYNIHLNKEELNFTHIQSRNHYIFWVSTLSCEQ